MDHLQDAVSLKESGLFRDALALLDTLPGDLATRIPALVQRAELLERVGRRAEAEAIVQRLQRSRSVTPNDRALCDFILARIRIEVSDFDAATALLNRAIAAASRTGNWELVCTAKLKLLVVLSDGIGTDAASPLLAEVRANAIKTGNPRVLAAVHVYCAQIEALRGSVPGARRHIRLAMQLLKDAPNLWLDSVIENIDLALSIMASEFDAAEIHARKGHELAERTGGAIEYAVNQGNSGFLWQILGRLDDAIGCYEHVIRSFVPGSQIYIGAVDSVARVRLTQGRLDESEALLASIERSHRSTRERATYVSRHVELTRAQLSLRRGRLREAEERIHRVLRFAKDANDAILATSALLTKVELLLLEADTPRVHAVIGEIASRAHDVAAHVFAEYERVLGCALASTGDTDAAQRHFSRADRVYSGLNHVQGLTELRSSSGYSERESRHHTPEAAVRSSIQSAVAILSFAKHPEFVARELATLLFDSGAVVSVAAVTRASKGTEQILIDMKRPVTSATRGTTLRLAIGEHNGRLVELVVEPNADIDSEATLHAVVALLATASRLQLMKEDQAERSTIWPVDDPQAHRGAILFGHMRELMTLAQRVARTTVNVMITGESGTGKEILARAVHDFSDRAQKAFVPLNCAAVPRDLLESQLFGHRRGAFTGAERDHLGLIRSADGGTVFLDEVGEMSLDLQPKLLRFLESGEISPLGEPSPLTVNVRVIAATNTNLEDAVRDGKFREDLFYRLNVVRLSIKPLRERRDEIPALVNHFVAVAAREYKKGHLQVAEETMERLLLYRWPGNVRQLQNEMRRMVALAEPGSTLEPDAISPDILGALPIFRHPVVNGREVAVPLHDKLAPTLSRIEYEMVKAALRANHGRLEPAAKALGISRKGLYLKRQRLGL